MSDFTPGPWEASQWRVCAGLGDGERIIVICDTANNKASRTPENEANARLIAAAPELLAEMKRYLPVLEWLELQPELWIEATKGTGIATANGYRHAIAKALG